MLYKGQRPFPGRPAGIAEEEHGRSGGAFCPRERVRCIMGNFQIGIISDWLRLPFEESMKKCAALGAEGVQLYAV